MNRRRFLQALGLAPVAAVAAKKYFFFGGILRPKPMTVLEAWTEVAREFDNLDIQRMADKILDDMMWIPHGEKMSGFAKKFKPHRFGV
jgi:hypothetical protein